MAKQSKVKTTPKAKARSTPKAKARSRARARLIDEMTARLVGLGQSALALPESDPVRKLGLSWYPAARTWIDSLAERWSAYGATSRAIAGAVAALSPQCSWLDQTRFLPGFLESVLVDRDWLTLPHPGFLRNRERACRMLLGAEPSALLSGPKVTAFFSAIMGDSSRAVIDRHAATLALGERRRFMKDWLVASIQEAYARAAGELGIEPRDLQSLLWCMHKASGAAEEHEQATFFEVGGRIQELGLGWADDPLEAFTAPAWSLPDPDPEAPNLEKTTVREGTVSKDGEDSNYAPF